MERASFGNGWEGRVVEGQFPLLERLGSSADCSTFLTLLQGSKEAVIELILANGADADALIAQWNFAMTLSHPHLTQVFAAGQCVIDHNDLVFVIAERSYSTLSKIIRSRTFKADSAREMFQPILDALAYLHQNGVVHGFVNPSNILLADLKPKLSGTNFLKAGTASRSIPGSGKYDAPELQNGEISAAADTWSMGMTIYEAMTRALPSWDSTADEEPVVTETLPNPYREIIQDCLRVDPLQRCTIQTILERLEASKSIPPPSVSVSVAQLQAAMDRPLVAPIPGRDGPAPRRTDSNPDEKKPVFRRPTFNLLHSRSIRRRRVFRTGPFLQIVCKHRRNEQIQVVGFAGCHRTSHRDWRRLLSLVSRTQNPSTATSGESKRDRDQPARATGTTTGSRSACRESASA